MVSAANAEAAGLIDAWPQWPGRALALVGPAGSGKTHLAEAWRNKVGPDATLIEDADALGDDDRLFHLINDAPVSAGLLLTSRLRPIAWPAALPDLRSRLNALSVAELNEPDDALLGAVMLKLFKEHNIRPAEDVLPFLLRRVGRSVPEVRALVDRIDEAAAEEGRDVTRVFVRQFLEIEADTPDLFE